MATLAGSGNHIVWVKLGEYARKAAYHAADMILNPRRREQQLTQCLAVLLLVWHSDAGQLLNKKVKCSEQPHRSDVSQSLRSTFYTEEMSNAIARVLFYPLIRAVDRGARRSSSQQRS